MSKAEITKAVNLYFRRIKLTGKNFIYPVNKSVGVKGLIREIGEEKALNLCEKAINSTEDVVEFKLRRGLTVKFESA